MRSDLPSADRLFEIAEAQHGLFNTKQAGYSRKSAALSRPRRGPFIDTDGFWGIVTIASLSRPFGMNQPAKSAGANAGQRLLFIDNLRWSMILLVVSMHAADTYSPLGDWYFTDRTQLAVPTLLVFAAWQMYLQSFFMGLLFFVAGFFVPASFDRKGPGRFLRDRAYRLGLPVVFYMFVLGPVTEYYVAHSWNSTKPTSMANEWIKHIRNGQFLQENGPLWFCLALLIFRQIGCASCHIPALPLDRNGWIYTEPNPYNPAGNLQPGEAQTLSVDLSSDDLPQPRLKPVNGVVMVPFYTDFKLHDICSGPTDPNREALNQNAPAASAEFFAGNERFLTRRLWAVGSKPNYFHHGQFTTIREAILNHFGEALPTQQAFRALSPYQRGAVIEFLKTLKAPANR